MPIDSAIKDTDDNSAQPYGKQRLGPSVVKVKDEIIVKQSISVHRNFSNVNQRQIDLWTAYGDEMRSRLGSVCSGWDTIESVPAHSEFTIEMEIEDADSSAEAVGAVGRGVDVLPMDEFKIDEPKRTEKRQRTKSISSWPNSVEVGEGTLKVRNRKVSEDIFVTSGGQSGEQSGDQSEEQGHDQSRDQSVESAEETTEEEIVSENVSKVSDDEDNSFV